MFFSFVRDLGVKLLRLTRRRPTEHDARPPVMHRPGRGGKTNDVDGGLEADGQAELGLDLARELGLLAVAPNRVYAAAQFRGMLQATGFKEICLCKGVLVINPVLGHDLVPPKFCVKVRLPAGTQVALGCFGRCLGRRAQAPSRVAGPAAPSAGVVAAVPRQRLAPHQRLAEACCRVGNAQEGCCTRNPDLWELCPTAGRHCTQSLETAWTGRRRHSVRPHVRRGVGSTWAHQAATLASSARTPALTLLGRASSQLEAVSVFMMLCDKGRVYITIEQPTDDPLKIFVGPTNGILMCFRFFFSVLFLFCWLRTRLLY